MATVPGCHLSSALQIGKHFFSACMACGPQTWDMEVPVGGTQCRCPVNFHLGWGRGGRVAKENFAAIPFYQPTDRGPGCPWTVANRPHLSPWLWNYSVQQGQPSDRAMVLHAPRPLRPPGATGSPQPTSHRPPGLLSLSKFCLHHTRGQ